MRQVLTTTLVVLMLTGVVAEAQAQRRGNNEGPNKERVEQARRGQAQGLRLPGMTDEQREQIKAIMLNGRKEALPLQNALREIKAELQTLRTAESYDEAAVAAKINEISDLQTSMMLLRERHRQEVRALLTEEQRVIFDTRKPNREARRGVPGRGNRK